MVKRNFLKVFTTVALTFCMIFAFTGCDSNNREINNQDLIDRINELEQKLEDADATMLATLQAKITALETANAAYKRQIDALTEDLAALQLTHADDKEALEAAIKANKDQADALTEDLNALTESVANATHIERTVIKPEDVGLDKPIAKYVGVEALTPDFTEKVQNIKIECLLTHRDYSFNYQLITFKTTLFVDNILIKNYDVSITQAKSNDSSVSQTFNTSIEFDKDYDKQYTVTWSEIILYRFV